MIGFSEEKSHAIVDMAECHILHPTLFALVAPLRALLQRRVQAAWRCASGAGGSGADVLVTSFSPDGLEAAETIIAFCQRHGVARFSVDDGLGAETRWEPEPVTITLGGVGVPCRPVPSCRRRRMVRLHWLPPCARRSAIPAPPQTSSPGSARSRWRCRARSMRPRARATRYCRSRARRMAQGAWSSPSTATSIAVR